MDPLQWMGAVRMRVQTADFKKKVVLSEIMHRSSTVYKQEQSRTVLNKYVTLDHKTSLKSLGYICSNSQKYTVWVKIIDFSFIISISFHLSISYQ